MANYTYKDLLDGRLPEEGDVVMLYHRMHIVKKNSHGYYLNESEHSGNDWIFGYLGIQNKKEFCGVTDETDGIFPHCPSLEHLRDVIKKLWTYMPLDIGDQIKVRKIRASRDNYAILTVDAMQGMSDEYITVSRISRPDWGITSEQCKRYGVYLYIEAAEGYCWSSDLLDFNHIKKHLEYIQEEDCDEKLQEYSQVQSCIEDKANQMSVSISIPIRTKTLEIQL